MVQPMMPGMMPGMLPNTAGGLLPNVGVNLLPGMMPNGMLQSSPTTSMMLGTAPGQDLSLGGLALPTTAMPFTPQAPPAASVEVALVEPEPEDLAALKLDPEVQKLCLHFEIETECAKRLDEEMAKRQDSKESDLARLYDILDDVGSPTCLLEIKISEMASGEFVGKVLEDREAKAVALNCGLSEQATQKLYE